MNEQEYQPEHDYLTIYVAGALDWSGGLKITVEQKETHQIGYQLKQELRLNTTRPEAMALIDDYVQRENIRASFWVDERDTRDMYSFRITRRDDLRRFLEGVFPYLAGRHDAARILLEEIYPRLDDGKGTSREGWLEVMEWVDRFREQTGDHARGRVKYDAEYFLDEWNMR